MNLLEVRAAGTSLSDAVLACTAGTEVMLLRMMGSVNASRPEVAPTIRLGPDNDGPDDASPRRRRSTPGTGELSDTHIHCAVARRDYALDPPIILIHPCAAAVPSSGLTRLSRQSG